MSLKWDAWAFGIVDLGRCAGTEKGGQTIAEQQVAYSLPFFAKKETNK